MKKLFISQPMRGKTDEEIFAERKNAIAGTEHYLNEEVEVIDSFKLLIFATSAKRHIGLRR